jgi:V/A-type H+-transporting ATPase subunit D
VSSQVIIPSRMELSKNKKQLEVTRRGHHLLKDKFDSLVKTFMQAVEEYLEFRSDASNELVSILNYYAKNNSSLLSVELSQQLTTSIKIDLVKKRNVVMNIEVPEVDVVISGSADSSLLLTSSILPSIIKIKDFFPKFIKLASLEKKCYILASELEKTRRRVNAIEYILIPEIESTIKIIKLHLAEAEISNQVRIMKSKEIILQKNKEQ